MRHLLFLTIASLLLSINSFGQGCSDAGFCTMGAMRPDQPYSKGINIRLRSIELNQYRGQATLSPIIYVTSVDFNFSLNDKTSFQLKLPYQITSGNFGTLSGPGDISISASRNVYSSDKFDINATIGTKIPTNNSDKTPNKSSLNDNVLDLVMPMYYQSSLGSYDLILGASLMNKQWLFAVGYQQALTENNNSFDSLEWLPNYPSSNYVKKHPHSNNLKRGVDIMLRIERNFRFDRFNYYIGLLPIYRISKDEILEGTERVKLDDTTGLAFTVLTGGGYHFNAKSSLRLTIGVKIVDRDVNPDGLSRDNVTSLGYIYKF